MGHTTNLLDGFSEKCEEIAAFGIGEDKVETLGVLQKIVN
jgi:hypothetical protein